MLKWYHPNPLVRLKATCHVLHGRLDSVLADVYQAIGISKLEGSVLSVVECTTTPLTVPQIARILGHSRQAIQGAVTNLQVAELLGTARNPHHKRSSLLRITPAGLAAVAQARQQADDIARPILAQIDSNKIKVLTKELFALLTEIEEAILDVEGVNRQ